MTWTPAQGGTKRKTTTTHPPIRAARASDIRGQVSGRLSHSQRQDESQRIIIASNRGPMSYTRDPRTGRVVSHPGAGGVVSGLLSAAQDRPVTWVSVAMTDAERAIARGEERAAPLREWPNISLRLVATTADAYRRAYNGVSNKALWFIQHYLLQPTTRPLSPHLMKNWEEGYKVVNEAVADAVIAELELAGDDTPVLFQDYHLYLAPRIVRERVVWARLAHFVHIPWPDARYWELAPEAMTRAIFEGLAANDIVGFQTERDARNFLDGAQRFLSESASVKAASGEVGALLVDDRRVSVRVYPIAVSPDEVFAQADGHASRETKRLLARARPTPSHQIILRVDRVEPTKNIVAGFQAYERLLQRRKRLRERVTFVALLVPSREGLAEYRSVMRETRKTIERINEKYGTATWQPIIAVFGNDRARALACMREYDALLVNPLLDGMNLVVKEGALLNQRAGVIVLSRTAGAYEQLGQYALGVPPIDIEAISDALEAALEMPARERRRRAAGLRAILERESAKTWLQAQIDDLTAAPVKRPRVVYRQARKGGVAIETGAPASEARADLDDTLSAAHAP
ncbi:MAG TPA: trehalose-6-phosphate synthase [Ktedonobacterales bacterium]